MATSAIALLTDELLHAEIARAAEARVRRDYCVDRVVPMYDENNGGVIG
jgi:hypothetical protein